MKGKVQDATMPLGELCMTESEKGVVLSVWAKPGASKTCFAGVRQGDLVVKLAAPAVEGKANKELVKFIARAFGIPKSRVEIVSGERARRKRLVLVGIGADAFDTAVNTSR